MPSPPQLISADGKVTVTLHLQNETRTSRQPADLVLGKLLVEAAGDLTRELKGIVGVSVEGKVLGLHERLPLSNAHLYPVYPESPEGKLIRCRSVLFVLMMAVDSVHASTPSTNKPTLSIESVSNGVFHCVLKRRNTRIETSEALLKKIELAMGQLVSRDDVPLLPIRQSLSQAASTLEGAEQLYALADIEWLKPPSVEFYEYAVPNAPAPFRQLASGPLVPYVNKCPAFRLELAGKDFVCVCTEVVGQSVVNISVDETRAAERAVQVTGVSCTADLTHAVLAGGGRVAELVEVSEAHFDHSVAQCVEQMLADVGARSDRPPAAVLVLIAGPRCPSIPLPA
jgi:hypothetical protein